MVDTWSEPAYLNPRIPSPARMYDYYLGGKNNFTADREAAEHVLSAVPHGRRVAQENRRFLTRAIAYMASQGVRQFLDLGTGFPTSPSVHEAAEAVVDSPRVVYVDNDSVVTTHNLALLADKARSVTVLHGDIRCPAQIFAQDALWQAIDFSQPVGILFVAVLHFIADEDDPASCVRTFTSHMAPGSFLAVSHVSSDGTPPAVMTAIHRVYRTASAPAVFRSREEIARFFTGVELVGPGLVDIVAWRTNGTASPSPANLAVLCGVGRKR
jgi:S-adenosyl methyltransferase